MDVLSQAGRAHECCSSVVPQDGRNNSVLLECVLSRARDDQERAP